MTRPVLVEKVVLVCLGRTLGPVRRQVRTGFDFIIRGHQLPDGADRRPPFLGGREQVVKDPFGLHGHGEGRCVTGLALLVRGGHGGGEPGHAVEAEGPFGRLGVGRDVRRPRLQITCPQAAQEVPEFLLVCLDGGFRDWCWMEYDETGVGS